MVPFKERFPCKPIFSMIHLAGLIPVRQALDEISLFEEEGVDGVIIENYHGTTEQVEETLASLTHKKQHIALGINILPNEFQQAYALAHQYGASFIQIDHVAGSYTRGTLDYLHYAGCRRAAPEITVLGGVWPKYYTPLVGSWLKSDLQEGMQRADAIVVTGQGTGIEISLDKVRTFREHLGDFPLIVGAGLTPKNAYEQLMIADGAIVGSCFKKDYETSNPIDRILVRDFMQVVKKVRADRAEDDCVARRHMLSK
ncbi:membrane biogenesis protein [Candidatus Pacearchaeota archaeon]|nr:membrane biogenesis protein [Candidatus Pacearchaeota archaeon]